MKTSEGINDQPSFAYWIKNTLKKHNQIISAVKKRLAKTTHKYGIEVPTSVVDAKRIDNTNGNQYWKDATDQEMKQVAVAFEILETNDKALIGWERSSGHLVFDVNMDFAPKDRWVKDGHKKTEPALSTFSGVVSRESVIIALTYSALNGIDVTACDIRNAYLQAPSSEKHYAICGP